MLPLPRSSSMALFVGAAASGNEAVTISAGMLRILDAGRGAALLLRGVAGALAGGGTTADKAAGGCCTCDQYAGGTPGASPLEGAAEKRLGRPPAREPGREGEPGGGATGTCGAAATKPGLATAGLGALGAQGANGTAGTDGSEEGAVIVAAGAVAAAADSGADAAAAVMPLRRRRGFAPGGELAGGATAGAQGTAGAAAALVEDAALGEAAAAAVIIFALFQGRYWRQLFWMQEEASRRAASKRPARALVAFEKICSSASLESAPGRDRVVIESLTGSASMGVVVSAANAASACLSKSRASSALGGVRPATIFVGGMQSMTGNGSASTGAPDSL